MKTVNDIIADNDVIADATAIIVNDDCTVGKV
jgi:hypothetical protein